MKSIDPRFPLLVLVALCSMTAGCAGVQPLRASLKTERLLEGAAKKTPLRRSHFYRDRSGGLSEEALQRILAAPVFLESKARQVLKTCVESACYPYDTGVSLILYPSMYPWVHVFMFHLLMMCPVARCVAGVGHNLK